MPICHYAYKIGMHNSAQTVFLLQIWWYAECVTVWMMN